MKKLLSILTISTLTASVPAPLLANAPLTRVKRDVGTTAKDVTTGFDIKIKGIEYKNWEKLEAVTKPFSKIDNKWYIVIWHGKDSNNWRIKSFQNINYSDIRKVLDSQGNYELALTRVGDNLFINKAGSISDVISWNKDNGTYFKSVYCWNGVNKPITPEIDSNGNIINWNIDKTPFQQGISFSLVDGSKTATWSNAGMRLTVDGETNINIDNPNVTEVLWNGAKQNMLDHKVNINVKPETSEKTHKLVIKYDIRGTKYTSEDIDVVMAAKIEPTKQIVKENLSELIKTTDLGNILDNNDDTIKAKIIQKNSLAIDFSQIKITDKTELHKLTASDYPTLSDLFVLIEKQEKSEQNKSHLYNVLWKLAKGADGYLWNGISTLSLKSDLIVFDTHELTANKNRQNAQLFLMLSFLDKFVKQNKAKNQALPIAEQQWICIAIDEAHLLINENNTLALNFLFEMTKRIRKYNGILYIMTQNINDFMGNANIKTQAQGIINNCLYRFVHHLAASDLQDYDNLIASSGRLNQYQKDTIVTAPTGTCLFSIGANNRMLLNVEASEIEQETFS
ncbi:hypothetical protein [Spiroplasma sp. ald]|uniref:hypothetical protein n=1 Tax=Spiroplasma sp. ald TaxID=2490849 RepID=UPI0037DC6B09